MVFVTNRAPSLALDGVGENQCKCTEVLLRAGGNASSCGDDAEERVVKSDSSATDRFWGSEAYFPRFFI